MKWKRRLISEAVSRVRAVLTFSADEKGARLNGGIHLDHGQGGYELPSPKKPTRKRAKKRTTR
jgi:hypothetical protein